MSVQLSKTIKSLCNKLTTPVVSVIVVAALGGSSAIYAFWQQIIKYGSQMLNKQMPVWATSTMVLLCVLHTMVSIRRSNKNSKCSYATSTELNPVEVAPGKFVYNETGSLVLPIYCPTCYATNKTKSILQNEGLIGSNRKEFFCYVCRFEIVISSNNLDA